MSGYAALQRRNQLRQIAAETKKVLPEILPQLPTLNSTTSSIHNLKDLSPLDPKDCPGFTLSQDDPEADRKGTRIRVYDQDTFDTALQLQPGTTVDTVFPPENQGSILGSSEPTEANDAATEPSKTHLPTSQSAEPQPTPLKPVAVLNLASEKHPGGGWQNGALAQEEALCFRSSLYLSLHGSYYPIPPLSALYSPNVLLIRDAMSRGHTLLHPNTPAASLPLTSIISVAGLRHPAVTRDGKFANLRDRETTKSKIRVVLRIAARNGHTKLVLGALGCGVFGNPPAEVAACFLEVLQEEEFQGGWWEVVSFAILDNARGEKGGKDGIGNFGVFWRALDGQVV